LSQENTDIDCTILIELGFSLFARLSRSEQIFEDIDRLALNKFSCSVYFIQFNSRIVQIVGKISKRHPMISWFISQRSVP